MPFELSNELLQQLQDAVEQRDGSKVLELLDGASYVDISAILYEFNTDDSKFLVELLDKETAADIINELEESTRGKFLRVFTPEEIAEYLHFLDSDDAVDIINELPNKEKDEVIVRLPDEEMRGYVLDLMRYDEDCAGGLMAKELIKCNVNWTVTQCIEEIRRQAENVERLYSLYVIDNEERFLGRVSLKRIILSKDNTLIADIYEPEAISVETSMDEEEVADLMRKYDLDSVPVINVLGKLVGRITIDDIVDVITEQAEEERQIMAGISEDVEEDDGIWMLSRARLPWLLIGLLGGMIGARVISFFDEQVQAVTALAFFIPLITATGGNVGIQSSSLVVQSLATKSAFEKGMLSRLIKVLLVALLNGLVLSTIVFGASVIFGMSNDLGFVIGIALFNVVILASLMGTITPLILEKFGVNPALASGPFITTANDILGLTVYFTVAHILL
ncbi:magnesium transporter [Flammeovirgaceae bacterium KN852]|uniref:Magnesium transporter MgtE n=1 Tax=Marinigracilibium pacificum TaxID=2729599 RepID=A0A848J4T4_9BACT|nr:magnesium transporter [Marinigracilibium pacificum]